MIRRCIDRIDLKIFFAEIYYVMCCARCNNEYITFFKRYALLIVECETGTALNENDLLNGVMGLESDLPIGRNAHNNELTFFTGIENRSKISIFARIE